MTGNRWENRPGHTCGPEGRDYESCEGCAWDDQERQALENEAQQAAKAEAYAQYQSDTAPGDGQ